MSLQSLIVSKAQKQNINESDVISATICDFNDDKLVRLGFACSSAIKKYKCKTSSEYSYALGEAMLKVLENDLMAFDQQGK
jgi:hypothetical protein